MYVTYFLLAFDQSDLSLVVFKNQIDLNLEQVSDLLFLFFDVPGCSRINFALLNLPLTILLEVQVEKVLYETVCWIFINVYFISFTFN